ncbi:T. brucei spp.-specific protein [Trypanosoma brucei gambiense DAL972]|uniref:T. brucei spp.-specific protein n=1 Tax=Trypanosoma brucei gambiense (strain MHOM/CI/86/DAL972) TaxID=679716 RepID=C9ZVP5_TRYB9|nr:T. brucei spp.-specific protein [Trypanosoma brucei gambiense DAL972]CBH13483.1 T. brucei spp.-specific protein [Trypanosoma brucei gambiense DAL972]|eukprot:XP_011775760.1 T. brucei spp.-specific protein [Trypanosoma brucei gambiense DAL972]
MSLLREAFLNSNIYFPHHFPRLVPFEQKRRMQGNVAGFAPSPPRSWRGRHRNAATHEEIGGSRCGSGFGAVGASEDLNSEQQAGEQRQQSFLEETAETCSAPLQSIQHVVPDKKSRHFSSANSSPSPNTEIGVGCCCGFEAVCPTGHAAVSNPGLGATTAADGLNCVISEPLRRSEQEDVTAVAVEAFVDAVSGISSALMLLTENNQKQFESMETPSGESRIGYKEYHALVVALRERSAALCSLVRERREGRLRLNGSQRPLKQANEKFPLDEGKVTPGCHADVKTQETRYHANYRSEKEVPFQLVATGKELNVCKKSPLRCEVGRPQDSEASVAFPDTTFCSSPKKQNMDSKKCTWRPKTSGIACAAREAMGVQEAPPNPRLRLVDTGGQSPYRQRLWFVEAPAVVHYSQWTSPPTNRAQTGAGEDSNRKGSQKTAPLTVLLPSRRDAPK